MPNVCILTNLNTSNVTTLSFYLCRFSGRKVAPRCDERPIDSLWTALICRITIWDDPAIFLWICIDYIKPNPFYLVCLFQAHWLSNTANSSKSKHTYSIVRGWGWTISVCGSERCCFWFLFKWLSLQFCNILLMNYIYKVLLMVDNGI